MRDAIVAARQAPEVSQSEKASLEQAQMRANQAISITVGQSGAIGKGDPLKPGEKSFMDQWRGVAELARQIIPLTERKHRSTPTAS